MNTIDRTNQRHLEKLTLWLRLRDVRGEQVGDILAEARAHVAATGETLPEAFGPPRHYARQWGRPGARSWLRTLPAAVTAGVGGVSLASGALALGRGGPALLGVPAAWALLIGVVVVLATAFLVGKDPDPVSDPRTGASTAPTRSRIVLGAAVACLAFGVLLFGIGLMLAAVA